MYAEPYAPKSNLAKAVAKPTVRREKMHGGEDVFGRAPFTDSDEDHARMDADRRVGPRVRVSAAARIDDDGSIGASTTRVRPPPPRAPRRVPAPRIRPSGRVPPDGGDRRFRRVGGFARRRARGSLNPRDPRGPSSDRSSPRAGPTRRRVAFAAPMGILAREREFPEGEPPAFASPWIVVLAPRLGAFILSLAVDAAVDRAARARRIGPDRIPLGRGTRPRDWTRGSWWVRVGRRWRFRFDRSPTPPRRRRRRRRPRWS